MALRVHTPTLTTAPSPPLSPSHLSPPPTGQPTPIGDNKKVQHSKRAKLRRTSTNPDEITLPPLVSRRKTLANVYDEKTRIGSARVPQLILPINDKIVLQNSLSFSPSPEVRDKVLASLRGRRRLRSRRDLSIGSSIGSQASPGRMSQDMYDGRQKLSREELAAKFRRSIWVVRIVVRVRIMVREFTNTNVAPVMQQTLEELNYYSMESKFSTEKLTFNKAEFSSSFSTITPLWARSVMQLPPKERSAADVLRLAALFRTIRTFKDTLSSQQQEDFARHCQYLWLDKRRNLVRAGHYGDCCYFIFSGSVFVNIQEQEDKSGRSYYRTLCLLHEGDLFGEVALIHGVRRTATITTREKVELLVLDKDVFSRVFTMDLKKQQSVILNHFQECGLFNGWPEETLLALARSSRLVKHTYDSVVERNTQTSQFIHIVTEGRIEVVRQVNFKLHPYGSSSMTSEDPFSDEAIYQRLKYPNQCSHIPVDPYPRPFVSLEVLLPYSSCDLRSLITSTHPMSLISKGAATIRIPKHHLRTLPSHKCWKDMIHLAHTTPRYPSDEVLSQLYQEYLQWSHFKTSILQDSLDRVHKAMVSNKPATLKGRCGWIPSRVTTTPLPQGEYNDCLSSSVPLHKHKCYRDCHSGVCVLTSSAVRSKSPLLRSNVIPLDKS